MKKAWGISGIDEYCLEFVSTGYTRGVYDATISAFIGQQVPSVVLVRGVNRKGKAFQSLLLDVKLYAPGHSFTDPKNQFKVEVKSLNPTTAELSVTVG
jgi:hypothetical protein